MSIETTEINSHALHRPAFQFRRAHGRITFYEPLKRLFDIVVSTLAIIILAPLFAVIAFLIAIDGGPALYVHMRVGKHGRTFGCLKFRSMILGAKECLDEYLWHHPDEQREWDACQKLTFDPRMTGIGAFLRKTSLDELPQLLNVWRGEMSLVGPRPVTETEMAIYGDKADLYKAVRPGITGLWQISGRNEVSYSQRVDMDARYVVERSFLGDLLILLRTPAVVISRKGAR